MDNPNTIDIIAGIFCDATRQVLEISTQKPIKCSSTIQRIPKVSLKPALGCFVQFNGDYNGLVVMNFSAGAAMELYRSTMIALGMPEDELARNHTSSEVSDSIGETVNQIMGKAVSLVEKKYDVVATCSQPKALALNSLITLTIDSDYRDNRRTVFSIEGSRFYMELAMEKTEFVDNALEQERV